MKRNECPAALAFLLGKGHLQKSFTLTLKKTKTSDSNRLSVLDGLPKRKAEAYERMVLFVDMATYQVRRVTLLDAQGNTNTFTFDAPAVNRRVAPAEFRFEPPRGTRVIRR
jgi:outer membrane lipoprotein carrier protein